jgi:hypothetical protein
MERYQANICIVWEHPGEDGWSIGKPSGHNLLLSRSHLLRSLVNFSRSHVFAFLSLLGSWSTQVIV